MNVKKYQIEENDKIRITELFQLIPSIIEKNNILEKNENLFSQVKQEIKLIYKKQEVPTKEQKVYLKKVRLNFEIVQKEYFVAVSAWNLEMDKIIEKYNYITLKKFLVKNPLKSIGINPDLTFSVNTKKVAELMKVPILQSLYSGEPKFLNNYPEDWLLKVYIEIDKMSTRKNFKIDISKL
ncbi:hypothetical protein [Flavobacterium lacisediminis]|uniref:Uncharacterized protein n=1 Tax=Flavobacterium lacisediminis TaxID=2989705 RepID=A0ABT3EIX9_9FLAO|nr:hypothetical protein [Flavobacterium lacisediminis]MCW1148366.1 hypothetical protein [Flavobacterium lacisediminis]